MGRYGIIGLALAILIAGCSTARHTQPSRTATEQLMISSAAERAAQRLTIGLTPGTTVFLNTETFEGYDQKYALGAIRSRILERGAYLVSERKDAAVVIEVRAGALALDQSDTLVGIPEMSIPIPLAGALTVPEIALFKRELERGIAKFAMVAYDGKTGELVASSGPVFGFSHRRKWVVLLFISWSSDDVLPTDADRFDVLNVNPLR